MSRVLLLVDDNENDRLFHQRALRGDDYRFHAAATIADGLALVGEVQPDAVLLDYNLTDGCGLDFIARLHELKLPDAPAIVVLTGSGNEEIAVAAMRAGASDYLIKDVGGRHLKLLPAIVERALREHDGRRAQRDAERQLQLAANVYRNILEGVVATDPDGTIVSVNPAFCAMTGYAADELIGRNPRIVKSNRHEPAFYAAMWDAISRDGCWQGEVWDRRRDGSLFLARETITAIRDDAGRLQNYVAVLIDITEARQAEEFIRHQAYHDALTELPNRSLFMDRLRHQLAYAQRQGSSLGVLFIDLDGFKAVNDTFGHEAGDDLLKEAARRLHGCLRESDTLARLGGDEFAALINDLGSSDDAALVARKMSDRMGEPFRLGANESSVTASIGIARYPADGDTALALLNAADAAMYAAKRQGKNRYAMQA